MAHGGVGDDRVDARVRDVERVDVTDTELDAIADPFLIGQTLRHVDQHWTLLDADHAALESLAAGQGTRHDAGAATELEHVRRAIERHLFDVGVPIADERRILTAELEALDETLQGRLVLLVHELHCVACGHPRSLAGNSMTEPNRAGHPAFDIFSPSWEADADDHRD